MFMCTEPERVVDLRKTNVIQFSRPKVD